MGKGEKKKRVKRKEGEEGGKDGRKEIRKEKRKNGDREGKNLKIKGSKKKGERGSITIFTTL